MSTLSGTGNWRLNGTGCSAPVPIVLEPRSLEINNRDTFRRITIFGSGPGPNIATRLPNCATYADRRRVLTSRCLSTMFSTPKPHYLTPPLAALGFRSTWSISFDGVNNKRRAVHTHSLRKQTHMSHSLFRRLEQKYPRKSLRASLW